MKSVISDNKIIPFLPCYKRTSQLHETKVSDLKTVYGCNGYAVYDYIENEIFVQETIHCIGVRICFAE